MKNLNLRLCFDSNDLTLDSNDLTLETNSYLELHVLTFKFQVVLKDVRKNLKLSVILFDGEFKPEDECLELVGKQKKISKSERSSYENSNQDSRPIIVQILEETTVSLKYHFML